MSDTLYINDTFKGIVTTPILDTAKASKPLFNETDFENPIEKGLVYFFLTAFALAVVYVVIRALLIRLRFETTGLPESVPTPPPMNNNSYVYSGRYLKLEKAALHEILTKHFPYYKQLEQPLQDRFLKRLQVFLSLKTFILNGHDPYKEMPILLSAAAIQITFGLPKYKLRHFKYLQIHPQEYFAPNSFRVLAGNVQGHTITIAWNHFLDGLTKPEDGANVGLHEMAHALYFQHLIADVIKGNRFKKHFNGVMEEGAEVYTQKQQRIGLFTANAFKDLQEFWAESVELFFERPQALYTHYPDLYEDMVQLLQQDPRFPFHPLVG